jgi:hypothetical protein
MDKIFREVYQHINIPKQFKLNEIETFAKKVSYNKRYHKSEFLLYHLLKVTSYQFRKDYKNKILNFTEITKKLKNFLFKLKNLL